MKRINWKRILSEYIFIILIAVLTLFGFCLVGYSAGHWIGQARGWNEGHADAMAMYPQMTFDNVHYAIGNTTISMRNLTIRGEQNIIDIINGLPSLNRIISFSDSDPNSDNEEEK